MLKHLKNARILVDCETGALHIDQGDGQCKAISDPFWVEEPEPMFDGEVDCSKSPYHFNPPLDVIENKKYQVFIDGIECNTTTWWDDGEYGIHVASDDTTHVMDVYRDSAYISRDYTGSHKITIIDPSKRIIHKLDGKYLPDPFWMEEKRTLVVEGVPDKYGNYNVYTQLEYDKEYTYVIDGVEYTGKCLYDGADYWVELRDALNNGALVQEYSISVGNGEQVYHKIELVEKVYHTHHDFMVKKSFDESTEKSDCQLLVGDFASAKAKIRKGFPVTALLCASYTYSYGRKEVQNSVVYARYYQESGTEYFTIEYSKVLPDNTIVEH